MAAIKFRYDNKKLEVRNEYSIRERGRLYLLNIKDRPLELLDICTLEIEDKYGNVQERDLPKNIEGDGPGAEFPTGTYFYYQITTEEMESLGVGRFNCSLRIHSEVDGYSRVVMREELAVRNF